jgi:hypothetical protein
MVTIPFPNRLTENLEGQFVTPDGRILTPGRLAEWNQQTRQAYQIPGNQGEVLPKDAVNAKSIPPNPPIDADDEPIREDPFRYKYDYFEIHFKKRDENNNQDSELAYAFALLPAIENVFRSSGQNVPDVNPGIKIQTEMNYQRHLVPGAPPVYQSMGTKGKYLLLVGAFIGNESINSPLNQKRPNPAVLDMKWNLQSDSDWTALPKLGGDINSYTRAKLFCEEVIQSGRPVLIRLKAASDKTDQDITIEVNGVVEAMRVYCVRADRTYYAITVSCLDFRWYRGRKAEGKKEEKQDDTETQEINQLLSDAEKYKKEIEELNAQSTKPGGLNQEQTKRLKQLREQFSETVNKLKERGVDFINEDEYNKIMNPENSQTNPTTPRNNNNSNNTPTNPPRSRWLTLLGKVEKTANEIRRLEKEYQAINERIANIELAAGIFGPARTRYDQLIFERAGLEARINQLRRELKELNRTLDGIFWGR